MPPGTCMNGPVSWLSYAYRFLQLPMGAVRSVDRLGDAAADFAEAPRERGFRRIPRHALALDRDDLLLTIPSSVGLLLLGESMIGIVYQHGQFLAFDTHQTGVALSLLRAGPRRLRRA